MIVNIDKSGRLEFIGSQDAAGLCELGVATKRRASNVEPVNPVLRLAFHLIRTVCEDDSPLADWTRRWRCLWRVAIVDGPILPGAWRDRLEAIAAEIEWIETNQFGA